MKQKKRNRIKPFDVINGIVLILLCVTIVVPFLHLFSLSLSPSYVATKGGLHLIPKDVTFDNYMQVFKNRYLWNGYKNTILRTVIGTVVQLFFTAMSAYAISKPYFPHRGFWTFYVVFTMFFSGGMIPSYLLIKNLHLFDTMAVLILPGLVGAYNMVLMRNFFSSLPEELEESCMIDGAGRFTIFFRIVLPCSKPILATVALWLAVADVFWAMARFGGEEMCVLPTYAVSTGSPINVVYNKQWLDNLNAEVPETLDEFVELMYRFTNEDPDGNGKDDTYGFSTSMLNVIFGAYGSFPGFLHMDYGHWYEVDGKLVSSNVMDGNEEALKLIKQLYDDGVIDPEFITGENKGGYWALSHSFMNGRIGVTHSAAHYHYQPALYDKEGNQIVADGACLAEFKAIQGEDAEVVVGPWPEGPNGDRGGFLRYNFGIVGGTVYNAALNDDPEKLAAIFAIRDIFCTDDELAMLANNGIEGKHYYYTEEGYFVTNSEIVPDNAAKNAVGIMAMRSVFGSANPDNYKALTAINATPAKEYEIEMKSQYEGLADTVGYLSKVWGSLPSDSDYSAELHTYRDETWLNMIQGKIELDWDEYVEEWYNRGGQILTEEANEWYEQNK